MKKKTKSNLIISLIVALIVLGAIFAGVYSGSSKTFGDDEIQMHFFHSRTCPHCHAQRNIHEGLEARYPNLNIIEYETSLPSTQTKLQEFAKKYPEQLDLSRFGTPTTIIGDRVQIGFNQATTARVIIEMIEQEQQAINASWNDATMTRTSEL